MCSHWPPSGCFVNCAGSTDELMKPAGFSRSRRAAVRPGGGVPGENRRGVFRHQQIPAGRSEPELPAAGAPPGHEEVPAAGPGRLHPPPDGPAEVRRLPVVTHTWKSGSLISCDCRPELARPATTLYQHNLTGILETAVRATNAQYDNAEILKRLDVRLLEVTVGY